MSVIISAQRKIQVGNSITSEIYAGAVEIKRAYIGETKVYNNLAFGTFNGLMISPPCEYSQDQPINCVYCEDWTNLPSTTSFGDSVGSGYWTFVEAGKRFHSSTSNFSQNSGSCNNYYKKTFAGFTDWRLPTKDDWTDILSSTRSGGTVNGTGGRRYALVTITDMSFNGSSSTNALLLIPDGVTITGVKTLNNYNGTGSTGVTKAEVYEYTREGCACLLALGYVNTSGAFQGAGTGVYMTATEYSTYSAYYFTFWDSYHLYSPEVLTSISKTEYRLPIRMVRKDQGSGGVVTTELPVKIILSKSSSLSGSTVVGVNLYDPSDATHTWGSYFSNSSGTSSTIEGNLTMTDGYTRVRINIGMAEGSASSVTIRSYNGGYALTGSIPYRNTVTASNYMYNGTFWLNISVS